MSFVDSGSGSGNGLIGDLTAPYALITSSIRFIGTIIADVTVREVHTDEFTITAHPVETGSPISDHYYANPQIVEINCGFSNSTAGYTGYVQEVYEAFQALWATREPFDVSTGKRFYSNMLIANMTVVTDETSEWALMCTVRLQQVIITDTSSTSGSDMTPSNQADPASTTPESNVGNQAPQATSGVPSFVNYQYFFGGFEPGT